MADNIAHKDLTGGVPIVPDQRDFEITALRAEVERLKDANAQLQEIVNGDTEEEERLRAEVEKLRAALWDIHAVCNNGPFVWARRIKAIARGALGQPTAASPAAPPQS